MEYTGNSVSQATKILFPIIVTVIAGIFAPRSVALVGFLMFGNLIRECGVLGSLSDTAQKVLANLITLLLGLTVAANMQADKFLTLQTLMILRARSGRVRLRYGGRRCVWKNHEPLCEKEG
jgi:oxaloacetate decarboxylase beta subunit